MNVPIYVVDAFATERFRGNPAAVCVLDTSGSEQWMQQVAAEMNLSETAFLEPTAEGWSIRWFTPAREVALCGHATLASAHVLWESGRLRAEEPARFTTRQSGQLVCERVSGAIRMDFPARPAAPAPVPEGLAEILGCDLRAFGRSEYDVLVEVAHEAVVRSLRPNLAALAEQPFRGLIVTAPANGDYDFVSRFFAPSVGVPEDPVTGSAHCTLGPYWAPRLGRTRLRAWQASARGGEVRVELHRDRVLLEGHAITVWRGNLV